MKYKKQSNEEQDVLINHWTPQELDEEVDKVLKPNGPEYRYVEMSPDRQLETRRLRLVAFKNDYKTAQLPGKENLKLAFEINFNPEELQKILALATVSEAIVCIDEERDFSIKELAEAIRILNKIDGRFLDISEIDCKDD